VRSVLNWGIIGLGNAAKNFASGFKDSKNSRLIAAASKNDEKLNYFKKNYNLEEKYCYHSYEQILKNDNIDIIYIALPNNLHSEWIKKSAKSKKNILVEKPAAIYVNELESALKEVKNNNIFFIENFLYRSHPQTQRLIKLIEENYIGKICRIKCYYGNDALGGKKLFGYRFKKPNKNKRLFNKELGGGAILDMGCYPVSMISLLASFINKNVQIPNLNKVNIKTGITGVDEYASVTLNYSNCFYADIEASIVNRLSNDLEIIGEKGKIYLKDPWFPNFESEIQIFLDKNQKTELVKTSYNIYTHQINQFSELIKTKENKLHLVTPDKSMQNMIILNNWRC
jgi:predicted dehydrogenase